MRIANIFFSLLMLTVGRLLYRSFLTYRIYKSKSPKALFRQAHQSSRLLRKQRKKYYAELRAKGIKTNFFERWFLLNWIKNSDYKIGFWEIVMLFFMFVNPIVVLATIVSSIFGNERSVQIVTIFTFGFIAAQMGLLQKAKNCSASKYAKR